MTETAWYINPTVIASLVSAAAVCGGAILVFINNKRINSQLKRFKYIDTITTKRMKWIDELRDQSSSVLSQLAYFQTFCLTEPPQNEKDERVQKITLDLFRLSLMLNPSEDRKLIKRILKLRTYVTINPKFASDGYFLLQRFRYEIQLMLKKEWEKVKEETLDTPFNAINKTKQEVQNAKAFQQLPEKLHPAAYLLGMTISSGIIFYLSATLIDPFKNLAKLIANPSVNKSFAEICGVITLSAVVGLIFWAPAYTVFKLCERRCAEWAEPKFVRFFSIKSIRNQNPNKNGSHI